MENTGWKYLPFEGGLLDQPDWLMQDLATISVWRGHVEESLDA